MPKKTLSQREDILEFGKDAETLNNPEVVKQANSALVKLQRPEIARSGVVALVKCFVANDNKCMTKREIVQQLTHLGLIRTQNCSYVSMIMSTWNLLWMNLVEKNGATKTHCQDAMCTNKERIHRVCLKQGGRLRERLYWLSKDLTADIFMADTLTDGPISKMLNDQKCLKRSDKTRELTLTKTNSMDSSSDLDLLVTDTQLFLEQLDLWFGASLDTTSVQQLNDTSVQQTGAPNCGDDFLDFLGSLSDTTFLQELCPTGQEVRTGQQTTAAGCLSPNSFLNTIRDSDFVLPEWVSASTSDPKLVTTVQQHVSSYDLLMRRKSV
ncbi:hypothetical protein HDU81_006943 [Chytriomyces hyalinus]|nr:hypothetical protein HDU81_006943 [Chytriomyces hyalinus]